MSAPGKESFDQWVEVGAGAEKSVAVVLTAAESPTTVSSTSERAEAEPRRGPIDGAEWGELGVGFGMGWRQFRYDGMTSSNLRPFDGKRMIFGGFEALVEEGRSHGGYTDGMVVPVPRDKKQAYRDLAAQRATQFKEQGATRVVEAWGEDVPAGKTTDFLRAVQARDDETVVFSFVEWPDKATRDEAWKKMMSDQRMANPPADMPFDGKRMIMGGFEVLHDVGSEVKR